jgi:diguanylate cyclase (GGDEF)-like protein
MAYAHEQHAPPPRPGQLSTLLTQLQRRHPARALDELLAEGVAFCADLQLEQALALVLPHADGEQRRLLLEPQASEGGARLQQLLDLLLQQTLRDPLTGLYNRRHFNLRVEQELRRALRDGSGCSLLLLDVDDFKQINDTLGHDAGDRALCQLAATLVATLRVSDEVARLGGDEFAALLPCTAPAQVVEHVDRRLRTALTEAYQGLSVSMGVAGFDGTQPVDGAELYRRADVALYAAKRAGKNAISAFDDGSAETTAVTADEREALLR